jgi:hypothetical protein
VVAGIMEETIPNSAIQADTEDGTNTDTNTNDPSECFGFLDNWLKYDLLVPTTSIPQSRIGLINTVLILPFLIILSVLYYIYVNQDWIVSSEMVSATCSKFDFVCTFATGCEINGYGVQTKPKIKKLPAVLVYNKSYQIPICHGLMEFVDIGPNLAASNLKVLYPNKKEVFRRTLAFPSITEESAYVATAYLDGNATKIKLTKFSQKEVNRNGASDLILTRGSHSQCIKDWGDPDDEHKDYEQKYMMYEPYFVPSTYVLVEPYVFLFTAEGSIFKINIETMMVEEKYV